MTKDDQIVFTAAFQRWFKGNDAAVCMCADFVEVAHVWDDLIDNDHQLVPNQIDTVFRKLMIDIPSNVFYRSNMTYLIPVLCSIWAQWTAANVLEKENNPNDLPKAYMLRASLYQLFHTCAALCGGLDWAKEIGPEVYRLYGETLETFNA